MKRFGLSLSRADFVVAIVIVISLIGVLLTHQLWLSIISVLAVSFAYSRLYPRKFFTSFLSGTVLGFVIQLCFITLISVIFWVFKVSVDLSLLFVFSNLFGILVSYVLVGVSGKELQPHKQLVSRLDLLALVVPVLFLAIYTAAILARPGTTSFEIEVVQSSSNGLDDQSQFNLFRDTIAANKGLVIGDRDNALTGNETGYGPYPRGSHLPAAVIADTSRSTWSDGQRTDTSSYDELVAYTVFKLIFFTLMLFVLTRYALSLLDEFIDLNKKPFKSIPGLLVALSPVAVVAYLTFGYMIEFMPAGFFSFMPVFFVTPLLLLAISELLLKKPEKITQKLFLVSLLSSFLLLTWTIIGMVAYAMIAVILVNKLLANGFKQLLAQTWPSLIVLLIGLFQLYIQTTSSIPTPSVNLPGAILGYDNLLLALLILMGVGLFVRYANVNSTKLTALFIMVVIFVPIGFVIALLNIAAHDSIQYYFTKTMYVPFVLLGILASIPLSILLAKTWTNGALTNLFGDRQNKLSTLLRSCAALAILLTVLFTAFIAFTPKKGVLPYVFKNSTVLNDSYAQLALDVLKDNDKSPGSVDVILAPLDQKVVNIMLLHTLRSGNEYNTCQSAIFDVVYTSNEFPLNRQVLDKCARAGIHTINLKAPPAVIEQLGDKPTGFTIHSITLE